MAQMGKDKPITMKNLERICNALDCTPNDVFSFDDEYKKQNKVEGKVSLFERIY